MFESYATGRVRILVRIVLFWALAIVAKLVYLQVIDHSRLVHIAQKQQQLQLKIEGARGTVYDRTGQPLAKSLPVDSVCVNPLRVPDANVAAAILGKVLDLEAAGIAADITAAADKKRGFLWIKRRVTPDESARLRSMNLDWIEFRTESRRFYPNAQLASHVVGSVDHIEHGNAGLELALDQDLAGSAGEVRMLTDVKQHAYASEVDSEALPGKDIYTTIDSRMQNVAERELTAAAVKSGAKTGSLILMNPKNGEILAMANYPTFDPNDPPQPGESLACRNNLAVTSPYEPGSVFKVVTLAAALETTSMRPGTMVNCGNGVLRLGSRTIHESHGGFGALSMADVLAKSSNIGAIQIGMRVGEPNMREYLRRFGFGTSTGVPLPGESTGKVRKRWGSTSLASVSMGHEVTVTAMQLVQLGAVIANGGLLVHPKLIVRQQRPGQAPEIVPEQKPQRVLRPETVITMRQMMEGVVLNGTAKGRANLRGYTSGGKTGTAQIFDFATKQYTHKYNGSFLGFAPVANPAIVMIVTLNGTSGGGGYGGQVAAPVFREVAMAALRILDVPKDLPEEVIPGKSEAAPVEAANDLSIAGLDPAAGQELEVSIPQTLVQGPPALDQHLLSQRSILASNSVRGPLVPDFQGKTMRDVMEEASSTGTPVEFMGRGIARGQLPPAGTVLPPGERVRVQFAR